VVKIVFSVTEFSYDKEWLERAIKYFTEKKEFLSEMNFDGMVYHDMVIKLLKERLYEIDLERD